MDGSHPSDSPVPNEHVVTVEWWRTTLDVIGPLGKGFEGELLIPYDWKSVRARYRLPDGTFFNNPEGDAHHKTEVLQSIGDCELTAHYHWDDFRFTAGTSIPTGRT